MPERVVLLIPGNPGDAHYYQGFVGHLQGRGHEVVAFDHARLLRPPPSMLPYATHQAERFKAWLRATGRELGDIELVIVGHSVGGYLAHLLEKHALLPIAQTVLLFPFLAAPAPSAFAALAVWRWMGGSALDMFRRLPRSWQRRLIERAGAGVHAEYVLSTLDAEHANSYAAMGAAEFDEVARYADASYVVRGSQLARRGQLTCLFTDNDRWSPRRSHPEVAAISYRLPRRVAHAFILEEASWPIVADALELAIGPGAPSSRAVTEASK
jgi:pimeloyl-ACP methyl ester carboxylesterase